MKFIHPNKKNHNWLFYKMMIKKLDEISKNLKGDIYDLGCGELSYATYLKNPSVTGYVGVDWSSTPHLLKADVVADLNEKLPIESNAADTIVSISVLEHLSNPQMMLNESFRILKPDGFLFMQIPFQWMVHEAPYDFFRYTPFGLQHLIGKAGYKNIKIESMGGYFTARSLKLCYFLSRIIKGPYVLRGILYLLISPVQYILQTLAPILDNLDKSPTLETIGYFVTAQKN